MAVFQLFSLNFDQTVKGCGGVTANIIIIILTLLLLLISLSSTSPLLSLLLLLILLLLLVIIVVVVVVVVTVTSQRRLRGLPPRPPTPPAAQVRQYSWHHYDKKRGDLYDVRREFVGANRQTNRVIPSLPSQAPPVSTAHLMSVVRKVERSERSKGKL